MRMITIVAVAVFSLTAGCARVITIEASVPPLVPVPASAKVVALGRFTVDGNTPPGLAEKVAAMLAEEIARDGSYKLATPPDDAQLVVSGRVTCLVTDGVVTRDGQTVKTRSAEVAVTFIGVLGRRVSVFAATERPTVEDKRQLAEKLPEGDKLADALLRVCVTSFVADITPGKVRAKVRSPGWFGSRRTRQAIGLVSSDPARAVVELARAVERDPNDAAALNALGFCSEVAGNLDLALSSYMHASAICPRDEYRENLQRVHDLLERRASLLKTTRQPLK